MGSPHTMKGIAMYLKDAHLELFATIKIFLRKIPQIKICGYNITEITLM